MRQYFNRFPLYLGFFILGVFAYNIVEDFFTTRPYKDLIVHYAEWDSDSVQVIASFNKNGSCELTKFAVIAYYLGVPKQVKYVDNDGIPENYDRVSGDHSLNITVYIDSLVDTVEIRTRHLCGEDKEVVDKVFTRLDRTDG